MHDSGVSRRGHVKSCLEGVDTNKIVMAGSSPGMTRERVAANG